ncbi:hypothetical protein [Marinobacterium sp. BA1]|uniref:hypothetical protein n=1 Tax=Marinobacterium sp. BA1 TaxID=3138931 RepID=UPI0032E6A879
MELVLKIITKRDLNSNCPYRFQVTLERSPQHPYAKGVYRFLWSHELSLYEHCKPDETFFIEMDEESIDAAISSLQSRFHHLHGYSRDNPLFLKHLIRKNSYTARNPRYYVDTDQNGRSTALLMLFHLYQHRLALGDDGGWHVYSFRDLALGRPGILLSDLEKHSCPTEIKAFHGDTADYHDDIAEFRFPSISFLEGMSHRLSDLKGESEFLELFARDGAGVYITFSDDKALYVGMSKRLSQRLGNTNTHQKLKVIKDNHPNARVAFILYPVWKVEQLENAITSCEHAEGLLTLRRYLFGLENAMIRFYSPLYNGISIEDSSLVTSFEQHLKIASSC